MLRRSLRAYRLDMSITSDPVSGTAATVRPLIEPQIRCFGAPNSLKRGACSVGMNLHFSRRENLVRVSVFLRNELLRMTSWRQLGMTVKTLLNVDFSLSNEKGRDTVPAEIVLPLGSWIDCCVVEFIATPCRLTKSIDTMSKSEPVSGIADTRTPPKLPRTNHSRLPGPGHKRLTNLLMRKGARKPNPSRTARIRLDPS